MGNNTIVTRCPSESTVRFALHIIEVDVEQTYVTMVITGFMLASHSTIFMGECQGVYADSETKLNAVHAGNVRSKKLNYRNPVYCRLCVHSPSGTDGSELTPEWPCAAVEDIKVRVMLRWRKCPRTCRDQVRHICPMAVWSRVP